MHNSSIRNVNFFPIFLLYCRRNHASHFFRNKISLGTNVKEEFMAYNYKWETLGKSMYTFVNQVAIYKTDSIHDTKSALYEMISPGCWDNTIQLYCFLMN